MTFRRTLPALFASVLFAGVAAPAVAAPAKPRAVHHRTTATHAAPRATHTASRRSTAPMRGGDAQNSTVDQLNTQSLQRATTGAPAQ